MASARLLVMASCVVVACGGREIQPPRAGLAPQVESSDLEERPLEDYVPAAGLRWLVVGRPREIAETRWLRESLAPLFPAERLDAYANATGLDLRVSSQGLVAGFDFGTLYLARTATANERVEELFRSRLPAGAVEHHPHPDLLVLSGMLGDTPAALVSQRGHLVGVSFGDPTLARIVEAYAQARLKSPTALRGAALATLPESMHDAPVRFYAPGPFVDEWQGGAHGVLGAATAVGVAVRLLPPDQVRIGVEVAGDWSNGGSYARAAVNQFYDDLAASALGRLLALDAPTSAPIVTVTPDHIGLSVDLSLRPLVGGLHAAVSADVWELLDPHGPLDQLSGEESTRQ